MKFDLDEFNKFYINVSKDEVLKDFYIICTEQNIDIQLLKKVIERLEDDLREMYLCVGGFSLEYTDKRIKELKGEDKDEI